MYTETTVELQWLEHIWNHGVVRANECISLRQVRRHNRDSFSLFFGFFLDMKVCCVFLLESPHRGDSNEYTQYTIFSIKKENHPKLSQICSYEIFQRTQEQVETAVVSEPSVFKPLKVYLLFLDPLQHTEHITS